EDPVRTFVRQVLGAVSQLEAAMIARRLRRGRQHKAEQGGYAFGGPPLGYRAQGGELVENDDEMLVVERIRELGAEGKSLRDIAKVLTGEGLRTKRSERWHPYTVKRVLDRVG
ncbi:MAG: recombinase family protein, partial [Acidimicrobiia bacterium]|nr:recombinase family protein [Acidimicrobiia bacterium]